MSKYWIRNRGRVQGPFTKERIRGLLRRGRFNRHFHVSMDRKEWLPADEYPELFNEGRRRRGHDDEDDDDTFRGGGSPFDDDDDDDYEEAPRRKSRGRKEPARKAATVFEDDDEYEDDDEEWEDDDDWEDDDEESGGLAGWIEDNIKLIAGVLGVAILGSLVWLLFFRESFVQDGKDLTVLKEVHMRVASAHTMGMPPNDWIAMQDEVLSELGPLVSRLESSASAKDAVKQEMLFLARDDIPMMLKEMPKGRMNAHERAQGRLRDVSKMIEKQIRYKEGGASLPAGNPMFPSAGTPANPGAGQQAESPDAGPGAAPPSGGPQNGGNMAPTNQGAASGNPPAGGTGQSVPSGF